ncbi:MAG TPA: hypothetical protein VGT78_09725 [Rhizomicrobium sp.]|nr:hypothetical protein [Rhizomicrobium sp.]
MPQHVFFSWQSDTPNAVGRSFVETCLERSIAELVADADVELADRDVEMDKDTLNVPGSPPIADTIFGKIDNAAVFLGDLTFVATRLGGGRSPNPNVLIEHGWALKSRGWRRVIAVMNIAFGDPDQQQLPFDLRHSRRPILYNLPVGRDVPTRKAAKEDLVKSLKAALKAIFEDKAVQAELRPPAPAEAHPHDIRLVRRFRKLFPEDERRFLMEQNFGDVFRRSRLDPIFEVGSDWKGAAFEFHDAEVQKVFADVLKLNGEFCELAATHLHASRSNAEVLTVKTDYDLAHGTQDDTVAAAKKLNDTATALSVAIEAFDRVARDRLRAAEVDEVPDEELVTKAHAWLQQLAMDGIKGGYPEIVPYPRLSLRLAPFGALAERRIDPRAATAVQQAFRLTEDEPVKEETDGGQWWTCARPNHKPNLNPETEWRMRLVRPGNFEFQCNIGKRIDNDPQIVVDGLELESTIIHTLDRMRRFAGDLGFEGGAAISIAFEGMEDVELRQGRRKFGRREFALPAVTVSDISEPVASAVQEQLDILWQMAGQRAGSPSFQEGHWTGYRRS